MLKIVCYIIFLLLLDNNNVCFSQQNNPDKISKKAKNLYEKALIQIENSQFAEAISTLQKCIEIDKQFTDAYLSLAGVYGQQKKYTNAIQYYEQAKQIDSVYFRDFYLPYSINLAGLGKFDKALSVIQTYLLYAKNDRSIKAANYRKSCYQFALSFLQQHTNDGYTFTSINLGDSVNSAFSEYFPSLTIDGKTLVFTRRVNNINEDFFETQHSLNNNWSIAAALPGKINTNYNEGAQTISQDGQWLIFTGCNFPGGQGSCDLYISYQTPQGWAESENLGNKINTEFWESSPSLSPDKKDLYFSSNRPGGFGGSDLYVSHRLINGKWTEPENLGSAINTVGDESCPFIHADNQTLYFTSNGWPGYGGTDLYISRKEDINQWSKPENLGYPINTIENEGSFIVAADGQTAYYASDRTDSKGGLDLYTFNLRKDIQPVRTFWIKGQVYDSVTKKGLPSSIEIINQKTQKTISNLQTDELGKYLIALPIGNDYIFIVNRKGYLYYAGECKLSTTPIDTAYQKNISLQPIRVNTSMVLNHIYFKTNSYLLEDVSQIELNKLAQLLQENPSIHIQIKGHTDNIGSDNYNMQLSLNRARAVSNYLIQKGIDSARILYKGYGNTKPITPNDTEEHRALNRRIEFIIVNK